MNYNPQIHHRRSIRLQGYNYAQIGFYFVTICVQNKECLLGDIKQGLMNLNPASKMVRKIWLQLPQRFANIDLDEFVIMPNHFHGLISISINNEPEKQFSVKLSEVIGAFKSMTTHQYIQGVKQYNWQRFQGKLWQRNYYEHIIRDEFSLNNFRQYIIDNPIKWENDQENPF